MTFPPIPTLKTLLHPPSHPPPQPQQPPSSYPQHRDMHTTLSQPLHPPTHPHPQPHILEPPPTHLPPLPHPLHHPHPPTYPRAYSNILAPLPPLHPTSSTTDPHHPTFPQPPQTTTPSPFSQSHDPINEQEMSNIDILAAAAAALAVAETTSATNNSGRLSTSSRATSTTTSSSTPRVSVEIERSALVQKKGRRRLMRRRYCWPGGGRFGRGGSFGSGGGVDGQNVGVIGGVSGGGVDEEKKVVSDDVMVAEFKVRDEKDRRIRRRKPRVVWSEKLHARFVQAVEMLGVEQAVPRAVLQLMNVRNLTRENVASHLQKYRNSLKAEKGDGRERGEGNGNSRGWGKMQRFAGQRVD